LNPCSFNSRKTQRVNPPEPRHEVDDQNKDGGQRAVHGEVGRHAGEKKGGEVVHPARALLDHHLEDAREGEQRADHGADGEEHHLKEEQPARVLGVGEAVVLALLEPEQACGTRYASESVLEIGEDIVLRQGVLERGQECFSKPLGKPQLNCEMEKRC
jgi:hypothetical protein